MLSESETMITILALVLFATINTALFPMSIKLTSGRLTIDGDEYECDGPLNYINNRVECPGGRIFKNGKLFRPGGTTEKPAQVIKKHHSFDLGRNYSLSVDNPSKGSYEMPDDFVNGVEVRGHDSDTTEIEVSILSDDPQKVLAKIEQGNNSLSISTCYADNDATGLVGYSLKVPQEVNIAYIKTYLGKILIENLSKEVGDVSSTSGKIIIKNIQNRIRTASTVSGSISFENVQGNVEAQTRSGAIDCNRVDGNVHLKSRSGSINAVHIEGDISTKSRSGHVNLHKINGNVSAETRSGHINCDDVDGFAHLSSRSGSINSNNIAKEILAKSVSGNIRHRMGKFQKSVQARTHFGRCYFNGIAQGTAYSLPNNGPLAEFSARSGNIDIN